MGEFRIYATVTVSAFTIVTAETEAEALAIAHEREAAIGGHETGIEPAEYFVIDDADGTPENIRVEMT